VDFYGLMPDATTSDGVNAAIAGFKVLRGYGRRVTPTYGLERNDDVWTELGRVVAEHGKGFCFRLGRDDITVAQMEETWSEITERTAQMGLLASEVDVLIDLKSLGSNEPQLLPDSIITFAQANPATARYRSLIVAGSSALRTLGDETAHDSNFEVRRQELHLWSTLWLDMPDTMRPIYADYGVVHPDFSDQVSTKYMNGKVRYTVADKIVYFRGHGLYYPVKDLDQYHDLARKVVEGGRFKGRGYSWGDAKVYDCATRQIRAGWPERWVATDMNHHLTYVANQVSRLIEQFAVAETEAEALEALAAP